MYIRRFIEKEIKESLKTRRVILLSGARQVGKTTLLKNILIKNSIYRTLDDITQLEAAISDPHSFVSHKNELMIIDEIQKSPSLIQAIKKDVDENTNYARFLITGSSNIKTMPTVTESLAGRIKHIRLRPLTIGEMINKKPKFLHHAFLSNFPSHFKDKTSKTEYINHAIYSGYPEILKLKSHKLIKSWHKDYIQALIAKDLKDIINIRKVKHLTELIEIMAAWSSKLININSICSSLSISKPTIENYIYALETLFLLERLKPFKKGDYDRLGKQKKLFINDSSLMASLLNWSIEDISLNPDHSEKLIETFVYNQLKSIIDYSTEEDYFIYHYRDREKREIDFIIENSKNELLGIEVKAGSTINKKMFNHLDWFKKNIAKEKKFISLILYTGETLLKFSKDKIVAPISILWN